MRRYGMLPRSSRRSPSEGVCVRGCRDRFKSVRVRIRFAKLPRSSRRSPSECVCVRGCV